MAQVNIQTAKQVAFAGKESTFGVLPTMKALIIEADSHEGDQTKEALEDMDASALNQDQKNFVDGLFAGSAKFKTKIRPFATQITSAAPVTQPAAMDLLEVTLGGMQVGAGSAISAGTTSQVTVAAETGFAVGQVFGISGSSDNQLAVVETKPGAGVITFWPSLGAAVTTGNAVNSYAAFVTETNEKSVSYQHAYPDSSNEQEEYRGCHGKVKITTDINSLLMAEFDLMPATGQKGALSISTALQSNVLTTGGFAVKDAVLYIQPAATTTRVSLNVHDVSLEFDPGMTFTQSHTGTEGKDGVMRVKGRGMAKLTIKIKADSAKNTEWSARTDQRILYGIPQGSGTTKRWAGLYAPKAVLARQPKPVKEGGRLLYELEYIFKIDTAGASNSLQGSPFQIFSL